MGVFLAAFVWRVRIGKGKGKELNFESLFFKECFFKTIFLED